MSSAMSQRVARNTADHVNRRIRQAMQRRLRDLANQPDRIPVRLRELDREWDIERAIEANSATLVLIGLTMGACVDRRWLILPGFVGAFLLQHAIQGWCPPVPILRRMGFRTELEIDEERDELLALIDDQAAERIATARASRILAPDV